MAEAKDSDVAAKAVNADGSDAKVDAWGHPETHEGYDPSATKDDVKAHEEEHAA